MNYFSKTQEYCMASPNKKFTSARLFGVWCNGWLGLLSHRHLAIFLPHSRLEDQFRPPKWHFGLPRRPYFNSFTYDAQYLTWPDLVWPKPFQHGYVFECLFLSRIDAWTWRANTNVSGGVYELWNKKRRGCAVRFSDWFK